MATLNFDGPWLKVERAEQHINELKAMLAGLVADNIERFSIDNQKRALKEGRPVTSAPIPKHLPTVLGDALHNLRASLDHAYCILIEANGHTPTEFSRFPFTKDWQSQKGSIEGHVKTGNGPSAKVIDFIGDEIQPFPGGKHRLFDLHRLDIADKHQCILPTSTDYFTNSTIIVDENGRVIVTLQGVRAGGNKGGDIAIGGGIAIAKNDLQSATQVTFGPEQPLEFEPMLDTIFALRESVKTSLHGLEKFIQT